MCGHYNLNRTGKLLNKQVKLLLIKPKLMSESNNLPQAISHKKLSFLLSNAPKDNFSNQDDNQLHNGEDEALNIELNNWESSTKALLKKLSSKNENLFKDKTSESLMALGAMEVHLNMALQALQVSKRINSILLFYQYLVIIPLINSTYLSYLGLC